MTCEFCNIPGSCNSDNTIRPFGRLGLSISDLFTKGYKFRHNLSTRKISKNGIGIESGLLQPMGDGVDGYIESDYSFPLYDLRGRADTTGELSGSVRARRGLHTAGISAAILGGQWRQPTSNVSVELGHAQYGAGLGLNVNTARASPVLPELGIQVKNVMESGLSLGVHAATATMRDVDVNLAAEMSVGGGNTTFAVNTLGKMTGASASVFSKVDSNVDAGVQVDFGVKFTPLLTAGLEYRVDRDTTVKIKAQSEGVVSTFVEHRLFNPLLRFGLSTRSEGAGKNEFGLGMSFGDYTAQ